MAKPIPADLEGLSDTRWGIGENADGTFNVFPPQDLARRADESARAEAALDVALDEIFADAGAADLGPDEAAELDRLAVAAHTEVSKPGE